MFEALRDSLKGYDTTRFEDVENFQNIFKQEDLNEYTTDLNDVDSCRSLLLTTNGEVKLDCLSKEIMCRIEELNSGNYEFEHSGGDKSDADVVNMEVSEETTERAANKKIKEIEETKNFEKLFEIVKPDFGFFKDFLLNFYNEDGDFGDFEEKSDDKFNNAFNKIFKEEKGGVDHFQDILLEFYTDIDIDENFTEAYMDKLPKFKNNTSNNNNESNNNNGALKIDTGSMFMETHILRITSQLISNKKVEADDFRLHRQLNPQENENKRNAQSINDYEIAIQNIISTADIESLEDYIEKLEMKAQI